MDHILLKITAVYWTVFWLGIVLLCMRPDSDTIFKDLFKPFKEDYGIVLNILSAVFLMLIIPASIPWSAHYIIKKWKSN